MPNLNSNIIITKAANIPLNTGIINWVNSNIIQPVHPQILLMGSQSFLQSFLWTIQQDLSCIISRYNGQQSRRKSSFPITKQLHVLVLLDT